MLARTEILKSRCPNVFTIHSLSSEHFCENARLQASTLLGYQDASLLTLLLALLLAYSYSTTLLLRKLASSSFHSIGT